MHFNASLFNFEDVYMKEVIFTNNKDGTNRDELRVESEANCLDFEIDNPWYGDTESGFGANLHISLLKEEVEELYLALGKWIDKQNERGM